MYSHSNGAPIDTTTQFSSFIIVRDDCTGFVIGTKGATVKNIAKTTRTWIRIQPANEYSLGMPWFLIKGRSAEAVATAHHYIKTIATEALVRITESEALVKNSQSQDEQNIAEYWDATEKDMGFCDCMIDLTKKEQRNYYGTDDIGQCYEIDAALTDFEEKDHDNFIDAVNASTILDNPDDRDTAPQREVTICLEHEDYNDDLEEDRQLQMCGVSEVERQWEDELCWG